MTIYEVRFLTMEDFRRQADSDNIGKIDGAEQQKRQNLQPITSKSSAILRSNAFNHPSLPELEESKLTSLSNRIQEGPHMCRGNTIIRLGMVATRAFGGETDITPTVVTGLDVSFCNFTQVAIRTSPSETCEGIMLSKPDAITHPERKSGKDTSKSSRAKKPLTWTIFIIQFHAAGDSASWLAAL